MTKKALHRAGLALVVLAGLVLVVAVSELAARAFGLGDPVLYYENESYRYALKPDQSVVRLRGAGIRIDRYGLRTDDDWDQPGALRVLFIGDSVTYGGAYIDNRELFSTRVCERLRASGVQAVCANAGTNGYGTDNMAYRIRFDKAPPPDVYVVTLIAGDTLRGLASLIGFPYFSRPLPPLVPGLTEGALFALDRVRARLRYGRGGGPSQLRTGQAPAVARLSLARLFQALRARAAEDRRVLLVMSPVRRNVEAGYDGFERMVLKRLDGSGFDVLDLLPRLRSERPDLDGIYYDGAHLEVGGHAFYGQAIAEALLERGLLRTPPRPD